MTPFLPLRIFLHLSIILPAWICTNFSDVLELLDHCRTDLCSELSGVDPLPYPSYPHEHHPLIRETEITPSNIPFHPNPNLRIDGNSISPLREARPSSYMDESLLNYDGSRYKQFFSQPNGVLQVGSQANVVPPSLVGVIYDANHMTPLFKNCGVARLKSLDSSKTITHPSSQNQGHFPLPVNSEFGLGPPDMTGTTLQEKDYLEKFTTTEINSNQIGAPEYRNNGVESLNDLGRKRKVVNSIEKIFDKTTQPRKYRKLNNGSSFTRHASTENSDQALHCRPCELAGEHDPKAFSKELDAFLNSVQQNYSPQTARTSHLNKDSFCKRLSHILKESLVRSKIYVSSYQKMDAYGQMIFQKKAFEFLKYFWRLALTNEEESEVEYHNIQSPLLIPLYFQRAKTLFESQSKQYIDGESASWYGVQAFVDIHWSSGLNNIQKKLINIKARLFEIEDLSDSHEKSLFSKNAFNSDQVKSFLISFFELWFSSNHHGGLREISDEVMSDSFPSQIKTKGNALMKKFDFNLNFFSRYIAQRYASEGRNLESDLTWNAVIKRVSFALTASFLHIHFYASLGAESRLRNSAVTDFDKQSFQLQKYFWELVFCRSADPPRDVNDIPPDLADSPAVQAARSSVEKDGTSEQRAETASWNATKFFVHWFWGEKLILPKKNRIKEKIIENESQSNKPIPIDDDEENFVKQYGYNDRQVE
ncbi:hypothetical protein O181_055564 [Austropuccinia psidii MF-1]|uniref:Uncharacterized protein n=1 Tax=Austropuccinia psidii MF-1 TaxID=1389203 RepID=A0A9Q3E6R3_9BASI|nr:hypothetical protein [Austropuccinia psidii MF-1]